MVKFCQVGNSYGKSYKRSRLLGRSWPKVYDLTHLTFVPQPMHTRFTSTRPFSMATI